MLYNLDCPIRVTNFGKVTQMHGRWHKGRAISENLVLYCTDGSLDMQIGSQVYSARKGDMLFIKRGVFYRPLDSDGCTYCFFHFSASEYVEEYTAPERITVVKSPEINEGDFAYSCHTERKSVVRLSEHMKSVPPDVSEILERAVKLMPSVRFYDIVMLDNILRELLITVQGDRNMRSYSKKLTEILAFVDAEFQSEITLGTLSERFGLSESYIARLFRRELSQKPSEYINSLRISAAKSMLLHTELTASEISEKVGFSDVYYFSRVFSKICGISPTAFRNAKA